MTLQRITRWFDGLRIQNQRDRVASLIHLARRERDIARMLGFTTEADFCQFRAQCYMLHTYYRP